MTAASTSTRTDNPYVGPTAFRAGDPLYGRAQDRDELLDLIVAERIVLLYSPSGAGKTSLIQAALVRALEEAQFEVLPIIRVTHTLGEGAAPAARNRYVLSTLLSLEEDVPPDLQRPVAELATLGLAEYLEHRPDLDKRPGNEVLIFDQFEEILTSDPTDEDAKRDFFTELGVMLRDRDRWAVFAMREDFLAALDPYLRYVPTRFRARYRLDLLTAGQALEAVTRPAQDAGVTFAPEAARRLVDDLRRVRVQRPAGTTEALGPYVEPVQLQVACHMLWSRLPAGAREISETDGSSLGDVEEALTGYYANRVRWAAQRCGVREGLVRDWFEDRLITPQGLRGQVLDGPLASPEADRALLRELVAAHLVRAESRRQATWYELAHDRFIEPVKQDNAAWRLAHLTPFERAAMLWDAEQRPDHLLLLGPPLVEAEGELAGRTDPLSRREREFIEASRRAAERQGRDLRNAARMRRLARGLAVAGAVALVLLLVAVAAWLQAREATVRAEAQERTQSVLFDAQRNLDLNQEASVILMGTLPETARSGPLDDDVRSMMYLVAGASPVSVVLRGAGPTPTSATMSGDGSTTVTTGGDGLDVWDTATGRHTRHLGLPTGTEGAVWSVDVNQDGTVATAGLDSGAVVTWDLATGRTRSWDTGSGTVWSVALTRDGTRVASVIYPEPVRIWDVDGRHLLDLAENGKSYGVSFSPDGQLVATVGADPAAVVWDAASGRQRQRLALTGSAWGVQFGPQSTELAVIQDDRTVTLWDVASGATLHDEALGKVAALAADYRTVNSDLTRVLAMTSWGDIVVFDVATGDQVAEAYVPGARIVAAGFNPADPNQILVLPKTGDVSIWRADATSSRPTVAVVNDGTIVSGAEDAGVRRTDATAAHQTQVVFTEPDGVTGLALSPDGSRVAVLTSDWDAHIWDMGTGTQVADVEEGNRYLMDAAFASGGSVLVTTDFNGRVTRWDATTGEEIGDLGDALAGKTSLATSPDGGRVLLISSKELGPPGTWQSTATIASLDASGPRVDLPLGKLLTLAGSDETGPRDRISSAAFSEDETGSLVALGTEQGGVAVFDSATGKLLWPEHLLHLGVVRAVSFTADGNLVTVGDDQQVLVTEAGTGQVLRRVPFDEALLTATLTPDGKQVVGYSFQDTTTVLPLGDSALLDLVRSKVTRDLTEAECSAFERATC